jgi:drug/metabolite transporter (DMT)-like permease
LSAQAVNIAPNNLKGALLLSLSASIFTFEVVLFRLASDEASAAQMMFFRALAQLVIGTTMVAMSPGGTFRTRHPVLQIVRGLTSLGAWYLYYVSFLLLDLALATTLTFSTSLFVVVLAAPVLGERVGATRWAATAIGFVGVVVATGAATASFSPPVLYGLSSAALAAVLVMLNRVLVRTEKTATIMFYIGLVVVLGTSPAAILDWHPLSPRAAGMLAVAAMIGAAGMWLTIEAYRAGEVSALAPFPYLRIVFAVALGFVLFAEVPGWNTVFGMLVIVATTIYITRFERRRGLATPQR